jgi:calmodulin
MRFLYSTKVRSTPLESDLTSIVRHLYYELDNDGTISADELGTIMRSLGQTPSEEELREIINRGDLDRSGAIDFQEFLTMMGNLTAETNLDDEMKEAFQVFDKDGSGQINAEELKNMMSSLGMSVHVYEKYP